VAPYSTAKPDPFDWLCMNRRVQQHQVTSATTNDTCGIRPRKIDGYRILFSGKANDCLSRAVRIYTSSGYVPTLIRRRLE
jgi:hypothetical protein